MGTVNPLGLDVANTWRAVLEGKSGIGPITLFDASKLEVRIAGEVKGFDPSHYFERKDIRHTDRFSQFAVAATTQAIAQAGITVDDTNREDIGVIYGSGIGGIQTLSSQLNILREKGPDRVSPFSIAMMISDAASGQISIRFGLKGLNHCVTTACASASDAIGHAWEMIRRGDAEMVVSGGSEAAITEFGIVAFAQAKALSFNNADPTGASRPFDARRDGFVMGEGGATLILEELEHAQRRGATILGEIIGYGASSDAYHVTQPLADGSGAAKAMSKALAKAGLSPSDVDYINAHGTSTPLNDKVETLAIKKVFGESAGKIAISSTKSMTGHLLGAAGAIEALFSILAITHGILPPTINLNNPDPDCDLDYVPWRSRRATVEVAMSNTFGFGGHNSVLLIRRFDR
jgi:3-oxoacyl-[acyl-carrier-protein] synthase II